MKNSKTVIESSLSFLVSKDTLVSNIFDIEDIRLVPEKYSIRNRKFFDLNRGPHLLVILNTQLRKRNEIISLRVNSPSVQVIDFESSSPVQPVQISLIWPNLDGEPLDIFSFGDDDLGFDKLHYELLFEVQLKPMSTKTFIIKATTDNQFSQQKSQIKYYSRISKDLDKLFQNQNEK